MLQRLRPAEIEGVGLEAALRELLAAFEQRNPDTVCSLQVRAGLGDLQPELSTAAYRVVQECLTNIARHARAHRVDVEVELSVPAANDAVAAPQAPASLGTALQVSVQDDGRGFDPAAPQRGFGLMGMRERVKVLDGVCRVDSAPSRGTRISVRIPLPSAQQDAA
jgi:two-component system sensor histidine kinase UhpB